MFTFLIDWKVGWVLSSSSFSNFTKKKLLSKIQKAENDGWARTAWKRLFIED